MTNEEMYGCNRGLLLSEWKEYGRVVRKYLEKAPRGEDGSGGFEMEPVDNPFEWLYKVCDTALMPEFAPGRLVVDDQGRYGVVLERMVGSILDHECRVDVVLVDFKTAVGKVKMDADKLRPAEFPPEFLDFASSYKSGGLNDRIHDKIDEAFDEEEE